MQRKKAADTSPFRDAGQSKSQATDVMMSLLCILQEQEMNHKKGTKLKDLDSCICLGRRKSCTQERWKTRDVGRVRMTWTMLVGCG
jgi:hypothetical protein